MARERTTLLDDVANDLALWIDQTADAIALAFTPQGVAPFAAQLTDQQKLEYYKAQVWNPDGTPNMSGRNQQIARLGPEGFAQLYKQLVRAYPELRPPQRPSAAVSVLQEPQSSAGME